MSSDLLPARGAGDQAPPSPPLQKGLREAVLAQKLASPRGRLAVRLWAGLPGAPGQGLSCAFEAPLADQLDHDTRVEISVALGNRARLLVGDPMMWLTRSGDLDGVPGDLEWQAASTAAWQELGLQPSFAVLTRHGWRHHPSGATRTWRRLRPRA